MAADQVAVCAYGPQIMGDSTQVRVEPEVLDGAEDLRGKPPGGTRILAGFWLWQVKDMDEAVEWVKRCPNPMGQESEVEIRLVFEAEDFGAEFTPEAREQEERLRAEIAARTNK